MKNFDYFEIKKAIDFKESEFMFDFILHFRDKENNLSVVITFC